MKGIGAMAKGAKGWRRVALAGGKVHVFSQRGRTVLQVRSAGDEADILEPAFKSAVELKVDEVAAVLGELANCLAAAIREAAKRPAGDK